MKKPFLTVSLVVVGLVAFASCLFAEGLFPAVPVHDLDERAFVREWVVLGPFPNPEVDEVFADGSSHLERLLLAIEAGLLSLPGAS